LLNRNKRLKKLVFIAASLLDVHY